LDAYWQLFFSSIFLFRSQNFCEAKMTAFKAKRSKIGRLANIPYAKDAVAVLQKQRFSFAKSSALVRKDGEAVNTGSS